MKTRIMLATDGQPAAAGAARLAHALSRRHGVPVEVVAAQEQIPIYGIVGAETMVYAQRQMEEAGIMALERRVQEQLDEMGPEFAAWPVTVGLGPTAPTIARLARQKEASLIVLGQGRHALADRWFGTETALRVMRISHVPVLAVPADADGQPSKAVVATDFSAFSREAIDAALDMLKPGGELHLVHVHWRPSPETPWVGGQDWIEAQRAAARERLESLAVELEEAHDVRVPTHFAEGSAAREVLRIASEVGAELLAAGSHGIGFFGRVLMGSVSTRLVRGARCPVLIVPPHDVPAELVAPHEAVAAGADTEPELLF
jgi:nucleotide-binding universal stress UspA family protein